MTRSAIQAPEALSRIKGLVDPAMRAAVAALSDETMRLIAGYQLGWNDKDGRASDAGGKAIRPALAVLSAEAVTGVPDGGIAPAVAVELVHNFSLLHDDVMDRDVERRHRPTGWVVFGEGQAILAGNAMLTRAVEVLMETGESGLRSLPCLLAATQVLISGQSRDLSLEGRETVTLDEVIDMEGGKTAALLACSSSIGALAAGGDGAVVKALETFGWELGIAFQLVDDVLGVIGDPAKTGKSSSSDVRAGKRSSVVVAALSNGGTAGEQLAELLAKGAPSVEEDVTLATKLVVDSGAIEWANTEADARLQKAVDQLGSLGLQESSAADLAAVATYVVNRDR
ncbi:MAG TPA: polyprenyl synthetase family protein [Jatrophihabitans sp.]|jgi:geranylgeranyl diphosphate synthase type I